MCLLEPHGYFQVRCTEKTSYFIKSKCLSFAILKTFLYLAEQSGLVIKNVYYFSSLRFTYIIEVFNCVLLYLLQQLSDAKISVCYILHNCILFNEYIKIKF